MESAWIIHILRTSTLTCIRLRAHIQPYFWLTRVYLKGSVYMTVGELALNSKYPLWISVLHLFRAAVSEALATTSSASRCVMRRIVRLCGTERASRCSYLRNRPCQKAWLHEAFRGIPVCICVCVCVRVCGWVCVCV